MLGFCSQSASADEDTVVTVRYVAYSLMGYYVSKNVSLAKWIVEKSMNTRCLITDYLSKVCMI